MVGVDDINGRGVVVGFVSRDWRPVARGPGSPRPDPNPSIVAYRLYIHLSFTVTIVILFVKGVCDFTSLHTEEIR